MIRETVKVKLTKEFKEQAMNKLDETIELVLNKKNVELKEKDKRKIKNLSLDQVNINISQRSRSKTMWVFDTENSIPIPVKIESKLKSVEEHLQNNPDANYYTMQSDLVWLLKTPNGETEEGLTHEQFEKEVLKILLEDFETAAFYGTLSYIDE